MTTIKRAETKQELEDIYRFRYRVYVEEMNRKQEYADHEKKMIYEPLDTTAELFGFWVDGNCVGTVRSNRACVSDLGYYPELYRMDLISKYHPATTSITTKLMIDRNHRQFGHALEMACAMYRLGRKLRNEFDFIDCNAHLIPFFEMLGYRKYMDDIVHHEYGQVTPLVLVLSDYEYLAKINSPFAAICVEHPIDNEAVHFFYASIGQ